MKTDKRAIRRHHRYRMIRKAKWVLGLHIDPHNRAQRYADNLKRCGCCLCLGPCKNPWGKGRKLLTKQEIKIADAYTAMERSLDWEKSLWDDG